MTKLVVCVKITGYIEVTLSSYPHGEGQGSIRELLLEANDFQTSCDKKSEESSSNF